MKERRMKTLFIMLSLLLSFSAVYAVDFDGLVDENESETVPDKVTSVPQYDGMRLPAKPQKLSYQLKSKPRQLTKQNFDPVIDAPHFQNFGSVVEVDDEGKHYQVGNCFGISYVTALWYQDFMNGSLLKQVDSFKDQSSNKMDGIEFLARKVNENNSQLFSKCGKDAKKCRLRNLSRTKSVSENVTKAMMFHQARQGDIGLENWATDDPEQLASQMESTKALLDKHGTLFFIYDIYSKSQSYENSNLDQEIKPTEGSLSRNELKDISQMLTELATEASDESKPSSNNEIPAMRDSEWNQFVAGHSMVLYRASEQDVQLSGKTEKALRLDFYDSNENYRSKKQGQSAEGFGSYLLYYPELKKITFSDHMRGFARVSENDDPGAVQKDQAFLENTQTVVGIQEFWSDHETREKFKADLQQFEKARKTTDEENFFWSTISTASSCADLMEAREKVDQFSQGMPMLAKKKYSVAQNFDAWYQKDLEAIRNLMADNLFSKRETELISNSKGQNGLENREEVRAQVWDEIQNLKCNFVSSAGGNGRNKDQLK